jgi:hypothetical protein
MRAYLTYAMPCHARKKTCCLNPFLAWQPFIFVIHPAFFLKELELGAGVV